MTSEAGRKKAKTAKQRHTSGDYTSAADAYTAAAYEYLGQNGIEHKPSVSIGLRYLATAATCIRHQSGVEECRDLCQQGVYISKMAAERASLLPEEPHPHDEAEKGVWSEFIGDFRQIGNLPNSGEAYDRAMTMYINAGDPQSISTEQFFMAVSALTKSLVRGTETGTEELDAVLRSGGTLSEWISFKQANLPVALKKIDTTKDWTYTF
jgi:hypothetical protein